MQLGSGSARATVGLAARIISRRIAAEPLALLAAFVLVLLAAAIVVAGPVYATAVADRGLRSTMAEAPASSTGVQVSGTYDASSYAATDRSVTSGLAAALAGAETYRSALSQSYELPGQPTDRVRNLAVLGFADRLADEAALVHGSWPVEPTLRHDAVVETAVSHQVATALGLRVGETMTLRARNGGRALQVRVVGIYHLRDAGSVMWWDSALETRGVEVGSFVTYWPFFVARSAFTGALARGASAYWRAAPDPGSLQVNDIEALADGVEALPNELTRAAPAGNLSVATGLPQLLRPAQRSLLVTRGEMLVPTTQVALLAGFVLLLAAGLVLETRHVETALLRARGATAGQVGIVVLLEAALVVVPATALGPVVALLLVRALERFGPVVGAGMPLQPHVGLTAFLTAGVTTALCCAALVVPVVLNARTFAAVRRERGRHPLRALVSRIRLDLVVGAVGLLLLWQLSRYGSAFTATAGGVLGIDPLLVAAPAVGLLGGALLALRVVPVIAKRGDRWASGQRGLPASLGAWQLARRPVGYTRSALLLTLALAIGVFAVAYTATWRTSQQDQAAFAVGADVRVSQSEYAANTAIDVPGRQAAVPGVLHCMPVVRGQVEITPRDTAALLGMDTTEMADVLRLRSDLSSRGAGQLARALATARTLPDAITLPGRARRLRLDVTSGGTPVSMSVVVRDAGGVLYRFPAIDTAGAHVATVSSGAARYPLALTAIEIATATPDLPRRSSVAVTVKSSDASAGGSWQRIDLDGIRWAGRAQHLQSAFAQPAVQAVTQPIRGGPLVVQVSSAGGAAPGEDSTFRLAPALTSAGVPLAVVVTDPLLRLTRRSIGDLVSMEIGGARRDVRIAASVRDVPTSTGESYAVIVDLAQLSALQYAETGSVLTPREWWLATEPGREPAVASALAPTVSGVGSGVLDRVTEADRRSRDVTSAGIIGGLALALVAAAIFAAVGFAVSVVVAVRQRRSELAVLSALGVSSRQVTGALALEQAVVVGVGLIGGTLLGLLLTRLVVPAFVLTPAGSAAIPVVRIVVPWGTVSVLATCVIVTAVAVVAMSAFALRGIRVGALLRAGGDG
ncbi:MAG: ABC transporter permease [Mycobacteriales bacterium]